MGLGGGPWVGIDPTMRNLPIVLAALLSVLAPRLAAAHCDAMDGPVIKTAQRALEAGNVAPVLAWVPAKDEAEIQAAFAKALAVRKLGPEAKELADRYFFETLVRIHRAGEGEPYTGLRPAGSAKDPALAAADRAIETGKLAPVGKLLGDRVQAGLSERFARLRALKPPGNDPAQGRAWVAAYVAYVHYVVGVYHASGHAAGGEPLERTEAHDARHTPQPAHR